jgi:putative ABC transport system permease protein
MFDKQRTQTEALREPEIFLQQWVGRTHEIGVRFALGAEPHRVMWLVLGQGFRLTLSGIALGLALSLAMTRLLANLLFNVGATDPITLAGVVTLLVLVTVLACYVPARRATRVDPLVALRHE